MPWCQEAMKGVVSCDKLRSAAKQALTRRFPNGETRPWSCRVIPSRIHRVGRRTGGTETSKYPEEEKANAIPLVAASETGTA